MKKVYTSFEIYTAHSTSSGIRVLSISQKLQKTFDDKADALGPLPKIQGCFL
jgi:hypothetical protein